MRFKVNTSGLMKSTIAQVANWKRGFLCITMKRGIDMSLMKLI